MKRSILLQQWKYIFFTISVIYLSGVMKAQSKVTFESLYSFEYLSDIQLSSDETQIAFTTRKGEVEDNQSITSVWVMKTDGSELKQVAKGVYFSPGLQWINNGEALAYLSWSKNGPQVYSYNLISGKAVQVSNIEQGVGDFFWSPDNNGFAFVTDVYPEDNSFEYYKKRQKEEAEKKHSGLLYDELLFRPYYKYSDGTITHLFYQNINTGVITDLTPGIDCAPASHLGGNKDISFTPDGKGVAFTMNTDKVKALSTNNDIFTTDLSGKPSIRITSGKGNDNDPRFSHDGKYLAYFQMERALYESDQRDIILVDLKTDERINLTKDFDRTLQEFQWSSDCKSIYFMCIDKGLSAYYKIDLENRSIKKLLGEMYFDNAVITKDESQIYLTKSEVNKPGEIYLYNLASKTLKQLTHFSDEFIANNKLTKTDIFWYKGAYNDDVMGFITYPVDYDANKKYPMLMLFHGGPEGAWTVNFSNYGWNDQLLASNGYFVLKINPHGSSSFGMKFQEDLLGNWGVIDVEDVLKGLDHVLAAYPAIDPERIGGLGRSYGGFLVNMLNGRTDRFKCFVSVDGEFDQLTGYYATDELWFPYTEFKGSPLDNPEIYKQGSPATFMKNFKTPALIIHGGKDYRVDLSQGVAMFTALQTLNIPSQILIFPDEGHYFLKLQTWKYAYEVQFEWLARWLKK